MSKIAIFVEGLTEQELTIKVIESLCGHRQVRFEIHRQERGILNFVEIRGVDHAHIYVLVANCSHDGQVKTQIIDRYNGLVTQGYNKIIGIRDVYPFGKSELEQLEINKYYGIPSGEVPIEMHFAIMETESWFLDEITHFKRISPELTIEYLSSCGYDVENNYGDYWDHPAKILDEIYSLKNFRYKKTKRSIKRTINALDMENFYINSTIRSKSLSNFIDSIESVIFL